MLCCNGMHASHLIKNVMWIGNSHDDEPWLCRVIVYGVRSRRGDGLKFVGRSRKIVWQIKLTENLLKRLSGLDNSYSTTEMFNTIRHTRSKLIALKKHMAAKGCPRRSL